MIKAIVVGVAAFLLSLGGTTFVLVKRGVAAAHESAAADSAGVHAPGDSAQVAPGDSAKRGNPAGTIRMAKGDSARATDTAAATRGDSTRPAPAGAQPAVGGEPKQDSAAPVPQPHLAVRAASATPADPAAKAAAVKQVARVLSAMKATEAAKVLAFLSDAEVEQILRAVGPRQAADFMTNLPKERAASLSRRLMVPREGAK